MNVLPFLYRDHLEIANARIGNFWDYRNSRVFAFGFYSQKTLNCITCKLNIKTESLRNLAYINKFIKKYVNKDNPLDICLL